MTAELAILPLRAAITGLPPNATAAARKAAAVKFDATATKLQAAIGSSKLPTTDPVVARTRVVMGLLHADGGRLRSRQTFSFAPLGNAIVALARLCATR